MAALHIGHLYLAPIGIALHRLFGVPYALYLHGGEMAQYLRYRFIRHIVARVIRGARLLVVNSHYTRQSYEAMGIDLPSTAILTIGVDMTRFRPDLDTRGVRARYGLDGTRVLLTVGRLVERKGHDIVIRALTRIRDAVGPVRYLVVGSGPEEDRLRALAADLGCGNEVVFAGRVPDDDLPALYASCDLFVMPSRVLSQRDGVEGFGIVFLEAGAAGKAVVGGRSGGVSEAVIDGVTGCLVDPEDPDALAEVLIALLRDPSKARELGARARERVAQLVAGYRAQVAEIWRIAAVGTNALSFDAR
jgi:phosphatidylinositol alpha-1,6-mannosyltransferase